MVYYDVCEDLEELQSMVHTGIQQADSPAVSQLKRRLQTLETKRGSICARRAYLRNKKVWASTINIHFGRLWGQMYQSLNSWLEIVGNAYDCPHSSLSPSYPTV